MARRALDLATHPDCRYAWGEADAAQVWGEAYFANHEPALAHRAFTQALAVRQRIEHPEGGDGAVARPHELMRRHRQIWLPDRSRFVIESRPNLLTILG